MASEVNLLKQLRFQTMCGNTNLHTDRVRFSGLQRKRDVKNYCLDLGEERPWSMNSVLLRFLEMSFFFIKREREINKQKLPNNWTYLFGNVV